MKDRASSVAAVEWRLSRFHATAASDHHHHSCTVGMRWWCHNWAHRPFCSAATNKEQAGSRDCKSSGAVSALRCVLTCVCPGTSAGHRLFPTGTFSLCKCDSRLLTSPWEWWHYRQAGRRWKPAVWWQPWRIMVVRKMWVKTGALHHKHGHQLMAALIFRSAHTVISAIWTISGQIGI